MALILGLMSADRQGGNMDNNIKQGDTLSPCPCCGHTPHRVDYVFMGWDEGYAYECKRCGYRAESGYTMPEAVELWNYLALPMECRT